MKPNISFMAGRGRSGMDAGDQAQHGIQRQDRAAAIADKGQGQADNRHDTDAHAHIDDHLENQSCRRAEADQPAHKILAPGAYIDAPGYDQRKQHHHQQTAQKTQLLTDGGEDIVRMLGEQMAVRVLGSGTIEEALARQSAAGKGFQALVGVITGAGARRVQIGIVQNLNAGFHIIAHQIVPGKGPCRNHCHRRQQKPDQIDAAGIGHADEDKHKNQRNAPVPGQRYAQSKQQDQMKRHMEHRFDRGYLILMRGHNGGHDQHIGDLADFRYLNVKGQEREPDPALVAVDFYAKRDQKEQKKAVNDHQCHPVLREKLHVDGGNDGIQQDTGSRRQNLDGQIAETGLAHIIGGTGNDQNAKSRRNQTQQQQYHIALAEKVFEFLNNLAHCIASPTGPL